MTTQAVAVTDVSDRTDFSGALIDTVSASGVGRLWEPSDHIESWSLTRDASYLFQMWKTAIPIWMADMAAIVLSVMVPFAFFQLLGGIPEALNWGHVGCWCVAVTVGCLMSGLYPATGLNSAKEIRIISQVVVSVTMLCIAYDLAHGGANKFLLLWPMYGGAMLVLMPLARSLMRRAVCGYSWWGLRTIIIGAGQGGMEVHQRLMQNPAMGFKPVAMVDRYRADWMQNEEDLPVGGICSLEDTPALSARRHVYCGIFVGSEFPQSDRVKLVDALTSVFPQLYVSTDTADAGRNWTGTLQLGNVRLLRVTENLLMPGARWIKRAIDIAVILLASPFLIPLVSLLALLVKFTSPGPIFYCHKRIGRNGKTIYVWKFRSMVPNADSLLKQYLADNPHLRSDWERLHKLPNDPRVTSIGRVIRKASLDEIPQLWNVLRGDMSLVGPRPIVQAEIPRYQSVYPLYLRMTPGITGLWQVNGRNSTTYEERISYDAEYVRNWSVCLDLYILARTVQTVVTCHGAS